MTLQEIRARVIAIRQTVERNQDANYTAWKRCQDLVADLATMIQNGDTINARPTDAIPSMSAADGCDDDGD